jgi:hypothetical protein
VRKVLILAAAAFVAASGAAVAQTESNASVNAMGGWQNSYQSRDESFRANHEEMNKRFAAKKAARDAALKAQAEARAEAKAARAAEVRPAA